MGKIKLYIATSLDGRIARKNGSLDWLFAIPNPGQIDHGYNEFLSGIGTTIMGRKTYDEILGFGLEWPYKGINSYVASTNLKFEVSSPETYQTPADMVSFVGELKKNSDKDIWLIGGGQLITLFLNNNLIDSMILSIIPIILGDGIELFPNKPKETNWTLVNAEKFETGIVNLHYEKSNKGNNK